MTWELNLPAPGSDDSAAAQWAVWGTRRGTTEQHLVGWSEGPLTRSDFAALMARYQLGSRVRLPQVAVSWVRGRGEGGDYVAVAFHEGAAGPTARSLDLPARSRRFPVAFTRYFALPYSSLARAGAGYLELARLYHMALVRHGPVPAAGRLASAPRRSDGTGQELAGNAAALLLEGAPVCLVGANDLDLEQRLRFLDDTASLLPARMRGRLSASTGADGTARGLNFRLFFAGSRPSPRLGARTVEWGQPETARPSPASSWYLDWIRKDPAAARDVLAGMSAPAGFSSAEVAQLPGRLSQACLLAGLESPAVPGKPPGRLYLGPAEDSPGRWAQRRAALRRTARVPRRGPPAPEL